jgi:hypothetical protein
MPGSALHVCLGGQLLDRLTQLFAGPLNLLLHLLNIIRRRRQRTGQWAFPGALSAAAVSGDWTASRVVSASAARRPAGFLAPPLVVIAAPFP